VKDGFLELLLPVAGKARRFKEQGIHVPKPLIPFEGKPLTAWALEGLRHLWPRLRVTSISFEADHLEDSLDLLFTQMGLDHRHMNLKERTQGPAETVLKAVQYFQINGPMISLDCDLYFKLDAHFSWDPGSGDGFILTFPSSSPDFSYAAIENGKVSRLAEKNVLSPYAVAGCYGFSDARAFARTVERLKTKFLGDEIFISHVIQEMIDSGSRFCPFSLKMHLALGTPQQMKTSLSEVPHGFI
jgi:NDP-sugar pyrophosphorylase family protein